MQLDFHYYATYCAALLAGYTHEESLDICYSAQFVDNCSRTLLGEIHAPDSAATTQLQLELMDARTDIIGLQDITRIWASFHFLPRDLYAKVDRGSKMYKGKYRLICGPNGELLVNTVELAKGKSLQAVGLAMHILADTWAHRYFAGTPSLVINNTDYWFYDMIPDGDKYIERKVSFIHSPSAPDNFNEMKYVNTPHYFKENAVMCLGHGRAGHLPDYSFMRYKYLPAWNGYKAVFKDNPSDYYNAFCQMIYAMKYLRGEKEVFETERYDTGTAAPYEEEIRQILEKRQPNAEADWKAFGEKLSGQEIPDFDVGRYQKEYRDASKEGRDETFLGRFILAALAQKSMVTNKIYKSGSLLAGYSIDYKEKGFGGILDFKMLIEAARRGGQL